MKTIVALFILLASGFASADFYPLPDYRVFGKAYSEADERAIDQLIERFRIAWVNQDAATVAAIHSDEVEWINAFGRTYRGADQLEKFLATTLFPAVVAEAWRQATASYIPVSRRYLGTDTAVINAQMHSIPGSAISRRVYLNFVLTKHDGKWEIAQQVISDIRERRGSDN